MSETATVYLLSRTFSLFYKQVVSVQIMGVGFAGAFSMYERF